MKLDPSTYQDNYHELQGPFKKELRVVDIFQNPLLPTQTHDLNSKLKLEVLTEAVFQLPDGVIPKFTNLLVRVREGKRGELPGTTITTLLKVLVTIFLLFV